LGDAGLSEADPTPKNACLPFETQGELEAGATKPALHLARKRWYNYSFAMKHKCPICKRPTDSATDADFPFCSERCRLQDLGAWAAEKYVVSDPIFDEEDIAEEDRREPREDEQEHNDTIH
jgi:uncharacterized protein